MEPNETKAITLEDLSDKFMDYLISLGTAQRTLDNHRYVLRRIIKYFNKHNEIYYSSCLLERYIKENKFYLRKKDPSHLYFRTCMILHDLANYAMPKKCYSRSDFSNKNETNEVIIAYQKGLENKGQSESTIETKIQRLKPLCQYLKLHNLEFKDITTDILLDIMDYIHNRYEKIYAYNLLQTLKDFVLFLKDEGYIDYSPAILLTNMCDPKASIIPNFYEIEEIQIVLDSISIDSLHGLRDYLAVYMITILGLRANDVAHLKKNQIDFSQKKIKIIQHKTKEQQILPLPDSLIKVIIAYLEERGHDDTEWLFIRMFQSRSKEQMTASAISAIISKHFKESGIEIKGRKHGSHSLRHSIASNMLNNDIGFPVVSKILGHTTTETTKTYAKISLEMLRLLVLEVPKYER